MSPQATLLIVEDEPGVLAALYEALSFHGYRIITAASLQEAERALQSLGSSQIHLVIADIHLTSRAHACEGYGLYQRWTKTYPDLPFILMSAYPSSQDLPDIRDGLVAFLAKPFEIPSLLKVIRNITGVMVLPGSQDQDSQAAGF
jgi:two-component system response regulator GlrR